MDNRREPTHWGWSWWIVIAAVGVFIAFVVFGYVAGRGANDDAYSDAAERMAAGIEEDVARRATLYEEETALIEALLAAMERDREFAEAILAELDEAADIPDDSNESDIRHDDICDRSATMQEALLDHFNMQLCRSISPRELSRLIGFDINQEAGHPDPLRARDFEGMPHLLSLELYTPSPSGDSERASLPLGMFESLKGLVELRVSGFEWKSVPGRNIAAALPNLQKLSISVNGIGHNLEMHLRDGDGGKYRCWRYRADHDDQSESTQKAWLTIDRHFGRLSQCP